MVVLVLPDELVMIKAKIEMNKHKGLIGINILVHVRTHPKLSKSVPIVLQNCSHDYSAKVEQLFKPYHMSHEIACTKIIIEMCYSCTP